MRRTFNDALHSSGPAADRAEKLKLYGWLVGDWEMDGVLYRDDGTKYEAKGEIHAGWVLERPDEAVLREAARTDGRSGWLRVSEFFPRRLR